MRANVATALLALSGAVTALPTPYVPVTIPGISPEIAKQIADAYAQYLLDSGNTGATAKRDVESPVAARNPQIFTGAISPFPFNNAEEWIKIMFPEGESGNTEATSVGKRQAPWTFSPEVMAWIVANTQTSFLPQEVQDAIYSGNTVGKRELTPEQIENLRKGVAQAAANSFSGLPADWFSQLFPRGPSDDTEAAGVAKRELTPEQIENLRKALAQSAANTFTPTFGKRQSLWDLTPEQIENLRKGLAQSFANTFTPNIGAILKRQNPWNLTPEEQENLRKAYAWAVAATGTGTFLSDDWLTQLIAENEAAAKRDTEAAAPAS